MFASQDPMRQRFGVSRRIDASKHGESLNGREKLGDRESSPLNTSGYSMWEAYAPRCFRAQPLSLTFWLTSNAWTPKVVNTGQGRCSQLHRVQLP